jgi:hypothetical protein
MSWVEKTNTEDKPDIDPSPPLSCLSPDNRFSLLIVLFTRSLRGEIDGTSLALVDVSGGTTLATIPLPEQVANIKSTCFSPVRYHILACML